MVDCKNCKHAKTLYEQERDRSNPFKASGFVMCSSPKYKKGRKYRVKDAKPECPHFEKRQRLGAEISV
jgi:hypothetical protein